MFSELILLFSVYCHDLQKSKPGSELCYFFLWEKELDNNNKENKEK